MSAHVRKKSISLDKDVGRFAEIFASTVEVRAIGYKTVRVFQEPYRKVRPILSKIWGDRTL
jgi:hypothetical protein